MSMIQKKLRIWGSKNSLVLLTKQMRPKVVKWSDKINPVLLDLATTNM